MYVRMYVCMYVYAHDWVGLGGACEYVVCLGAFGRVPVTQGCCSSSWGVVYEMHMRGWSGVQVRGQLEVLRSACREVQGSQDFTTLLQAVLALGNHLNEGTHKGNASGTLPHHYY